MPDLRTRALQNRPLWAGFAFMVAVLLWQATIGVGLTAVLMRWIGGAAHVVTFLLTAVIGAYVFQRMQRWAARADADCSTDPSTGLEECERQLLVLADALPVGVIVVRGDFVHAANATAQAQFGGALANRPVRPLFAHAYDAAALAGSDKPPQGALELRRIDGSAFRAEVGARVFRLGRRGLRLVFVSDLSERDRAQAQIAHQHEELQAMARRLLCVQEDERSTLSRELHDDIGQQITAIKLGAMALQNESDPQRRAETLAEIIATTDQTVAKVRNLSLLLRPPQLDALGLEAALRWQTGVLFRNGQPRLDLAIEPLSARPPPDVELACFRIAQEALTNVLRHADARQVRLRLQPRDGVLVLDVEDDGHGFARGDTAAGLGLVTMRERAQQLGGRLDVDSAPGLGTRVHAELPLVLTG